MFLSTVLNNVWLAVGLWIAFFCLDYFLALKAARMYQMGANKHFVFSGGYELNSYFKEDVAQLRRFSFRFFVMLVMVGGFLLIIHPLAEIFAFIWGTFMGVQLAVQVRHIGNLALFYYARDSRGTSGKIETDHWLSMRLSAIGFLSFAMLYLGLFLLLGSLVLLGATVGCCALSLRHFLDSARKTRQMPRSEQ